MVKGSKEAAREELSTVVLSNLRNEFTGKDGVVHKVVSDEAKEMLEGAQKDALEIMRGVTVNSDEEIKNDAYKSVTNILDKIVGREGMLNNMKFEIVFHRDEFKFLLNLIRTKFEYTVDTIHYGVELANFVEEMGQKKGGFLTDDTSITIGMSMIDVHNVVQLLNKHTERGLTRDAYTFANLLTHIGFSSRVYAYYKNIFEELRNAFMFWTPTLEKSANMTIDTNDKYYKMIYGENSNSVKPELVIEPEPVTDDVTEAISSDEPSI